jgi:2'-hydroxyisoflavone reductase
LWYAGDEGDALVNTADPSAALAAGLAIRPLAESIRDLATETPVDGFLTPDREQELLASWSRA